ncbi:unnamed protein product, partial [Menidia menidia]
ELDKASGNNLGGQLVDRKFKAFLKVIFCEGVWDEYEKNYPSEVQKMMYDFTRLKQVDDDVAITCSFNLGRLAQKEKDIEEFFEPVEGVTWDDGSIKISKERLRGFFAESLDGITESLREIFKKDFRIEFILLVGGYAASQILRQHITRQFGGRCKVLCPSRAQEAIVNGAVQFGRSPELVTSRKSAYTYGVEICTEFDESEHKAEKKFSAEGSEFCRDIFSKLVEEGEDVSWNETRSFSFFPIESNQTAVSLRFFRTERKNLVYVDDWGVEEAGSFIVSMPDTAKGLNREVRLDIQFGSAEIAATATDVDEDVAITCSFNLGRLAQKEKDIEEFFEPVEGVTWDDGSIRISKERLRGFFAESLDGITESLREIFKKDFRIEFILLVGGYAASQILRQHITRQFGGRCKVLCPSRAQEAIVNGAVQFGRSPELVTSRKSACTYGVEICTEFDESEHKAEKKFSAEGSEFCRDIFSKLVEEGEDVRWNETRSFSFFPIESNQTAVSLRFYRTERKNLVYVDDWGVEEAGSFIVSMPDTAKGLNREVRLDIQFGSAEIAATATDVSSGSKGSIKIDFMTKSQQSGNVNQSKAGQCFVSTE